MLRRRSIQASNNSLRVSGLGVEALRLLSEAREETGLPVVTEVMSTEDVDVDERTC